VVGVVVVAAIVALIMLIKLNQKKKIMKKVNEQIVEILPSYTN
jgi:hypothetical protein